MTGKEAEAAETERRRKEAEAVETERRRKEAEAAETERRCKEAEAAESERRRQEDKAANLCRYINMATLGMSIIQTYEVKKFKQLPGTYHPSAKGDVDRLITFSTAVREWPHLFDLKGAAAASFG